MLSSPLKCDKSRESKNPKVARTIMLLSKCVLCDTKKSKFLKEQETKRLLNSLGVKALSVKFLC